MFAYHVRISCSHIKLAYHVRSHTMPSEIPDEYWQRLLSPEKTQGELKSARRNCIHKAITIGLSPSVTVRLVEIASGDISRRRTLTV
jgi:hypothetical protein